MYRAAIITASDKGARGEREDLSAEQIKKMLIGRAEVVYYRVFPDERKALGDELARLCDEDLADVIFTTGGTGFSQRDVTPEATLDVVERVAPGIPEAMRAKSLEVTSRAMLSRAAAGIRKGTLIINLPGSPKAVKECLEVILDPLEHGVQILRGSAGECAN